MLYQLAGKFRLRQQLGKSQTEATRVPLAKMQMLRALQLLQLELRLKQMDLIH